MLKVFPSVAKLHIAARKLFCRLPSALLDVKWDVLRNVDTWWTPLRTRPMVMQWMRKRNGKVVKMGREMNEDEDECV